jgi:plastocyanin
MADEKTGSGVCRYFEGQEPLPRRTMSRISLVLIAALAAFVVAVGTASAGATQLVGTDGPGFTITLTKGGKKVTSLKPGAYKLVVHDKSGIHNFHLTGPGLNKSTAVSFVGNKTFTFTLKKGTYRFVCDPHRTTMKGSFKVG